MGRVWVDEREFSSLREALATGAARLKLDSGLFTESVAVTRELELVGQDTVLEGCRLEAPHVTLYGGWELRRVQVEGRLTVMTGRALLEDCEIVGNRKGALAAVASQVTVRRCRVQGDEDATVSHGGWFVRLANALAEDSVFHGGGIEVYGSRLLLRRCRVEGQRLGLRLQTTYPCTVEDCEFLRSREGGALTEHNGFVYFWGSRFDNVVRVQGPTRLLAHNCELRGLEAAGRVRLRNCVVSGLRVQGPVVARNCKVEEPFSVENAGELELEGDYCPSPDSERRVSEHDLLGLLADGKRDFAGWNLESVTLDSAPDLRGLDVSRANLSHTVITGSDLRGARFAGTDFQQGHISDSNLTGADFEGADMRGARIYASPMGSANLRGADLSEGGLLLRHSKLEAPYTPLDFREARLTRAELAGKFSGSKFTRADARLARLAGSDFSGADLTGTRLRKAVLQKADLSGACLRGSDLQAADLSGANLRGADLSDSDLRSADFSHCDARGANFEGAQLGGACWFHTELEDARFSGDFAEVVRAHLERAHQAEEKARRDALERERLKQERVERGIEDLALSAFGEEVKPYLGRAGRVLSVSLVRDFQIPARLLQAAHELVEAAESPGQGGQLAGIEYYARSGPSLLEVDSTALYRSLFDFGKRLYPEETEFEQHGGGEFESAEDMRRYRKLFTPEEFSAWAEGYILWKGEGPARARLQPWLTCLLPELFASSSQIVAFGLTDEDNENTEFGVYLVFGDRCAVVIRRRWFL